MSAPDLNNGRVTISKEQLAELEPAQCSGEIVVVDSTELLEKALETLRKAGTVGFDTETRPSFRKGQTYNVSLLQFSTGKKTFLIRLNKLGLTKKLIEFIEDESIKKIGLSIKDDFHNLNKLQPLNPVNFIDLQNYVKGFKIADNSLSKIYAILFGKRICKGQRLTNWESDPLTPQQQQYAALDAIACLDIYQHLETKGFKPEKSPYYTTEPIVTPGTQQDTDTPSDQ